MDADDVSINTGFPPSSISSTVSADSLSKMGDRSVMEHIKTADAEPQQNTSTNNSNIEKTKDDQITDQFHSLDDLGWYGSAYLLTTFASQLMFGKLYTFYSIKWTYLMALSIFELGSLIARASVGSGAFLIVAQLVPLHQRPTYTGIIGSMYGIACVAGPLMGGVFTDNPKLTWRRCFYINLPSGIVTAVFVVLFVTSPPHNKADNVNLMSKLKLMDIPGTIFFLPGICCLLLALQWVGLYTSGVMAVPIWFQAIKSASPIESGVMNLPMLLGFVIFSLIGGSLISIIGYYIPFVYLTIIFMSVGGGLLTTLEVDSGHPKWIGYQFLFGAGSGLWMQQTMVIVQTALQFEEVPIGTAIVMFSQNLTGVIVVSVAQNVFTNQLVKNLSHYVPKVFYDLVLVAYNKCLTKTFYVGVALSCCAIFGAVGIQSLSAKEKEVNTRQAA
ncbi:MFS general substrate transporter [Zopfia rhizophila CBS 207.26]|uniref:MFS general substrate transporter n=1 Tax=Zopfia rhizophila CBS 207.26 TaxID=1314779 RepID=A0A6A6EKM5_9PEZI|nr:MFS general substrate transporter [Zopfia rhizophila CBS 207.26]